VASVGCVLSAVASRYRSAGSMLSVLSKLMIFISAACETAVCSALAMSMSDGLKYTQKQNKSTSYDQLHWLCVPDRVLFKLAVSERPRTTVSVGALHPGLQC